MTWILKKIKKVYWRT